MKVKENSVYENLDGDIYKVVKIKSENDVKVVFPSTGYSSRVRMHLVEKGLVRDFIKVEEERSSWTPYEEEFTTNSGHIFKSFAKKGKRIRVSFGNTGYSTEVDIYNARAGKVKDPFEISVYGEGYLGLPDKSLPYWRPALQLWQNMMKRCYSEKDCRGYYGECFVDERWKSFENFLNDIKYLKGFGEWIKGADNPFYLSNLDKDFYKPGNNTYSRHYCRFLPASYNKSLGKKGKTEEDWA